MTDVMSFYEHGRIVVTRKREVFLRYGDDLLLGYVDKVRITNGYRDQSLRTAWASIMCPRVAGSTEYTRMSFYADTRADAVTRLVNEARRREAGA